MSEEKCLMSEAADKCPCEFCDLMRQYRDHSVKWIIENIAREAIEKINENKIKKTTKEC